MILVDSNIFMYAAGSYHPNKIPSIHFLHKAAAGEYECCINAEILQELLHRYRAIGRWSDGREVYLLAREIVPIIHPVDADLISKAFEFMDLHPNHMARDCVHAAHCMILDLEAICSYDGDFDSIEGIRRIEPDIPPGNE